MYLLLCVIYGLLIGSFLNVVIFRLPRGESLTLPPSHCPNCQHRLGFWDLFPAFSILFLGFKCRYCQQKISLQYPAIEIVTAFVTVLWWVTTGSKNISIESVALLILSYVFLVVAVIDFQQQIIPDKLTYPMIIFGFVIQGFLGRLPEAFWGMVTGAGILLIIVILYPRGMGWGDVKFLAMTGVFLGWQKVLFILFLGSFFGVVVMLPILCVKRKQYRIPFAFGPFLVMAAMVTVYFWDSLLILIPTK